VTSGAKFLRDGKSRRPSSFLAAFSKFVVGSVLMGAFAVYGPRFPLSNLHDPTVAALPMLQQFATLWITLVFCKAKYYAAWKVGNLTGRLTRKDWKANADACALTDR
jgi:hypothetical protein